MTGPVRSSNWSPERVPEVSVIVSTYGRAALLRGLLTALEAQRAAPPFEVVVADNGSRDNTWEVLSSLAPSSPVAVTAVRVSENCGAGVGRNRAVAASRGRLLAFTDDDCLPAPDWLACLVRPFTDPDVALVQGRTEPEPAPAPGAWARTMWVHGPTPWLETCNIAYRRAAYEEVGGFDEGERRSGARAFGEDTWLGHRVLSRGGRPAYTDAAVVHHRWRPGTFRDHLAERRLLRGFPGLAARVPAVADQLWGGVFLSSRTAAVDLAVAGALTAVGTRRAAPLVAVLPWLRTAWVPARSRRGSLPLRLAQGALADLVGLGALARGSLEHRRLVL